MKKKTSPGRNQFQRHWHFVLLLLLFSYAHLNCFHVGVLICVSEIDAFKKNCANTAHFRFEIFVGFRGDWIRGNLTFYTSMEKMSCNFLLLTIFILPFMWLVKRLCYDVTISCVIFIV